ncbi:MAG: sensor histidine kinase [Phycisphaerales bacterium JB052]
MPRRTPYDVSTVSDEQTSPEQLQENAPTSRRFSTHRMLSGMKIRKKLIVLHTAFSLGLGAILLIAIRPAMSKVIHGAEIDQAERVLEMIHLAPIEDISGATWRVERGAEATISIADQSLYQARLDPNRSVKIPSDGFSAGVVRWLPVDEEFIVVRARAERARGAIQLVYLLMISTLLVGYALVAAALELFVLPQHVYRPIQAMLDADRAVSMGERDAELIPETEIPADELGSIMQSRNDAIMALRTNERELAYALDRLEHTAADLHKKNHLLETARKNLEGADRLASLGMMSAGIAHELNTPLAVVKGLVEKLNRENQLSETEIALLTRVVRRLETLSDGLLDFARVRPPMNKLADLSEIIHEAYTLVMLDRKDVIGQHAIGFALSIEHGVQINCDPDRLVQVFVNLIRNAVDALAESGRSGLQVRIEHTEELRDGVPWVSIRVIDNGPGIDSELVDRLFEPFVSTRLDSQGTGLGLAVANGIIREHGGVLIATNHASEETGSGAVFEVLLPINQAGDLKTQSAPISRQTEQ